MYFGLLDQKAYDYTTAILQIPHWLAFVPILISLALLALAAVATILEESHVIKQGDSYV
jgi:TRAP-type C4-dicarboxylate transport system permease small subunit